MLASLRGLAASFNIKLAWAQDRAQLVFTSLHGGINIAAASQFPLARRLLPSHLSLLRCHPRCLKEQSTDAACLSKIFTHSVLAEHKGHSLTLSDVYYSNKSWTCWLHLLSIARTHLFTVGIPPFLNLTSGSCIWLIWSLVKKNKYSCKHSHPTYSLRQGGCICCAHARTHTRFNTPDTVLTPFPVQLVPFFPLSSPLFPISQSVTLHSPLGPP